MALGLIAINGGFCLIKYIIIKMDWHRYPKIPLEHNAILKISLYRIIGKTQQGKSSNLARLMTRKS